MCKGLEPVAIVGELYPQTRGDVIAKGFPIGAYLYAIPPDAAPAYKEPQR